MGGDKEYIHDQMEILELKTLKPRWNLADDIIYWSKRKKNVDENIETIQN